MSEARYSNPIADIAFYAVNNSGFPSRGYGPQDPRRDLVRAGALIVAEIQRLDRSRGITPVETPVACPYCHGNDRNAPCAAADSNQYCQRCNRRHPPDAQGKINACVKLLVNVLSSQDAAICQIAGKALGYPWFKDDQKNFPGATEKDGVCVGDHVAESIVEELATAYRRAKSHE